LITATPVAVATGVPQPDHVRWSAVSELSAHRTATSEGRNCGWPAQSASRWGAAGSAVTSAEQRSLSELRESVRAVLETHTHGTSDAATASRLTVALLPARLMVTADAAGAVRLASADQHPFARAVGAIAIAIAEAAGGGTWARLKSCPGHRCGWAFYDRSPAGRSQWCSMQLCGARAKMRAYRRRQADLP
jgi:predicted RNA-binding Zn ribbon-like protein